VNLIYFTNYKFINKCIILYIILIIMIFIFTLNQFETYIHTHKKIYIFLHSTLLQLLQVLS